MRHTVFVVIEEETIKTLFDAPEAIQEIPKGLKYEKATEKEDDMLLRLWMLIMMRSVRVYNLREF